MFGEKALKTLAVKAKQYSQIKFSDRIKILISKYFIRL